MSRWSDSFRRWTTKTGTKIKQQKGVLLKYSKKTKVMVSKGKNPFGSKSVLDGRMLEQTDPMRDISYDFHKDIGNRIAKWYMKWSVEQREER
jgi:hypothetical protein